jgi:16S rRNA (cytidine1402-2'-O)-methyltransferase
MAPSKQRDTSREKLTSALYVIATPIGNLEDVTYRAVRALREIDALACEDTRRTRILLERYDIPRPGILFSYHEHNEERAAQRVLGLLGEGRAVGLVTNAGYPGVSDPGYRAISQAAARGFRVEVLPGAGAAEPALVLSGLPGASFTFKGFAPRTRGRRRSFLAMEKDLPHTLIFFESPRRLAAFLDDALDALGDRRAAVCIEITKMFEQVERGYLSELAERFREAELKGEVTVVIAGGNPKFMRSEEASERGAGDR